jgi:hypothetical protein
MPNTRIVIYTISGIKAILQDSSVKIAVVELCNSEERKERKKQEREEIS